jgi:hypothetical protein
MDFGVGVPGEIRTRNLEHRFLIYVLMLTLVLPRVIHAGTLSDSAAILLTWSALGLVLARRVSYPIPRAIVWRPRDTRSRRYAVVVLERLGRVALPSKGIRSTVVWDRRLLAPSAKLVDPPTECDLGEDLARQKTRAIP